MPGSERLGASARQPNGFPFVVHQFGRWKLVAEKRSQSVRYERPNCFWKVVRHTARLLKRDIRAGRQKRSGSYYAVLGAFAKLSGCHWNARAGTRLYDRFANGIDSPADRWRSTLGNTSRRIFKHCQRIHFYGTSTQKRNAPKQSQKEPTPTRSVARRAGAF
jgi:hypothetical protein